MRIVLADDHALVRAGIRALLEATPGVTVVGEASEGRDVATMVERERPDVLLLDINMPGLNGLEVAQRVCRDSPSTKVIILSMYATEVHVAQALRAGVHGYLLKDAAVAELHLALKAVTEGGTYLSPSISRQVVEAFLRSSEPTPSPLTALTARQREILQLIAEGKTTKEIAWLLNVSAKTVETHRSQLMDRLGIHDVAGLVRLAIREGLISPER